MSALANLFSHTDKRVDDFKLWLTNEYETLPSHLQSSIIFHLQIIAYLSKSTWKTDVVEETDILSNLISNIQDIIKHSLNLETTINFDESDNSILESHERTIDDQHQSIQTMKHDLEKLQHDNFILKEEYDELQHATKEMQAGILSEFSSLRSQLTEKERKNRELLEELELAHRVRHDATIASLVSVSELNMATQAKEKAEALTDDYIRKYDDIMAQYHDMKSEYDDMMNDHQATLEFNQKLELKVTRLELELRGLDQAEASMANALQMKNMMEQRSFRIESELKMMIEKQAIIEAKLVASQSEVKKLQEENRMLGDRVDYYHREKIVLQAELKAAGIAAHHHQQEKSKLEQVITGLKADLMHKDGNIEAMLSERQEMEEFVRILRTQLEELQQQHDRKQQYHDDHQHDGAHDNHNHHDSISHDAMIQDIQQLRELLYEAEDKIRYHEQVRDDMHNMQGELYEEINKLQAEHDVLSQMNHNLQLQLHHLQQGNNNHMPIQDDDPG